jgi:hypothetical protein
MKMLINVILPIEPFNSMVRNCTAGDTISRIIDDIKPESIYFTEQEGSRSAVMIVEIPDASGVPAVAEPWFLNFEAHCEFRIAMTPEDLARANLNKLAEKWNHIPA